MWRHVTMVAQFLDDNNFIGSFCKGDAKQQRNNWFRLAKNIFARASRFFCTFLSRCCTTATWNFLISRALYGVGDKTQKFCFSFSKLTYGPFGFNPENFFQHLTNQVKLNKIVEVWNSANTLLRDILVCCHPKILLPWQRDVTTSPLYTRKGYYSNQLLWKRLQANFNWQFLYAALKYASQLGFVIGDTWKYNLYITNILLLNNEPPYFTMSWKGKLAICGFFKIQIRLLGPNMVNFIPNQ